MARQRRKPEDLPGELPLTPMIDVVFQLLIYFIVTIKPIDIFAHLDVSRPSPEAVQEEMKVPPKLIRVNVFKEGFVFNDRPVTVAELDRLLTRLAELDPTQTILIMVSAYSEHHQLIQVLDLCAKAGLTKLSVISTN